jgi:hypothetical protein
MREEGGGRREEGGGTGIDAVREVFAGQGLP